MTTKKKKKKKDNYYDYRAYKFEISTRFAYTISTLITKSQPASGIYYNLFRIGYILKT